MADTLPLKITYCGGKSYTKLTMKTITDNEQYAHYHQK